MLKAHIKHNISLKPYNTFGLDVNAKTLIEISDKQQLTEIFSDIADFIILGGGSNILFTYNIEIPVLKIDTKGIELIQENENEVFVLAQAGENWDEFVAYCVEQGWYGLENLSLIPGTVGACPVQNIGAFGVEVSDCIHSVEVFHIQSRKFKTLKREECGFGYRESNFKKQWKNQVVITSVCFQLQKSFSPVLIYSALADEFSRTGIVSPDAKQIRNTVIDIRNSKLPDPAVVGNAGSFFKNPLVSTKFFQDLQMKYPQIVSFPVDDTSVKLAAGWLIEQCGWKGKTHKGAAVHERQALVLLNKQKAAPADILELSEMIIDSVCKKFQVTLEPEVNIL